MVHAAQSGLEQNFLLYHIPKKAKTVLFKQHTMELSPHISFPCATSLSLQGHHVPQSHNLYAISITNGQQHPHACSMSGKNTSFPSADPLSPFEARGLVVCASSPTIDALKL
jgi:hypothetical protein